MSGALPVDAGIDNRRLALARQHIGGDETERHPVPLEIGRGAGR